MEEQWLKWARALQSIAQNGLAYSKNSFDIERFEAIRQIAVEMLSTYSGMEATALLDLFTGEEGYVTPKIDVRGAAFRDNKILLVRELLDNGRWTLPGGWADAGDSPSEAVEREVREESGFEARATKLAMVYDRDRHGHPRFYFSIFKLFFICEITGGEPVQSIETSDAEFFPEDDLPDLSIGRVTPEEIHTLFHHFYHPETPTVFD